MIKRIVSLWDKWCERQVNRWVLSNRIEQHPKEASFMSPWISEPCLDWRKRKWSVQASEYHYCHPRKNNASPYTEFEVCPPEQLWDMKTDDVVAYAPAREVYYAVMTGRLPKRWASQQGRLRNYYKENNTDES